MSLSIFYNDNISIMNDNIMTLYDKILFYDKKWLHIKKNTLFSITNNIRIQNAVIPNYHSYPKNIQTFMSNNHYTLYYNELNIKDKYIFISLFDINSNIDHLNVLRYIYIWISIVCDFDINNDCSKYLNIYICLNPITKNLPTKNGEPIGQTHANSAFTFSCKKNNEIHIFREEEWFKVFIHETFHAFGLDFSNADKLETVSTSIFPINNNFYSFESYSESWATIIHTLFTMYIQQSSEKKFDMTLYNKLIEDEIMFSIFQCCKIMKHFNINYDMLCNNKNLSYSEKTPVISYFFFKSILLFDYISFLTWCKNNNKNLLMFNNANIINFSDLISTMSKNDVYIKHINHFYYHFEDIINDIKEQDITSLRMTIHNIN